MKSYKMAIKRSYSVMCLQHHGAVTRSKAAGHCQSQRKRRREEETEITPLQIEYVLENIFSFLDADSIKACRLVNKLWNSEGAKILLTKCFIRVPSDLQVLKSTKARPRKNSKMGKFKTFLAHKSTDFSRITNITICAVPDIKVWSSLGVLGEQVNSLKLNLMDERGELLQNLLVALPRLNYLSFNDMDCRRFDEYKGVIMKVLKAVMSAEERVEYPLVMSFISLQCSSDEELWRIEEFANCPNIKLEEVKFAMMAGHHGHHIGLQTRIANAISKLLTNSQKTLKRMTMYYCETFLSLVEFPCMTALTHMELNFFSHSSGPTRYQFSPSFRFADKVPNLYEIFINYEGVSHGPSERFLENLYEKTGAAQTVKVLKFCGGWSDFIIDPLFQLFPNIDEFHTCETGCSKRMFHSIFKNGKHLKRLSFSIYLDRHFGNVKDLDSIFTGFPKTAMKMIKKNHRASKPVENLESFRVYPSVLNLKELEVLTIHFRGHVQRLLRKRMLTIAGEFAFKLMPNDASIIISAQDCVPKPEYVKAALDQVSQLPNVLIQ